MTKTQAQALLEWIDHLALIQPTEWKSAMSAKTDRCLSIGEQLRRLLRQPD
jgi:hypothetical protein